MRDIGQIQGAFIQGLGMFTQEKVVFDPNTAETLTDSTLVSILYRIVGHQKYEDM